jgi:A/G-specific adenine glycosylase
MPQDGPTVRENKKQALQRQLLEWFEKNKRDFYWRKPGVSIYEILIAEMLLQKTQAEVVEPVLKEFIARYPTIVSVHKAPRKEVEKLVWKLGLFRHRSKNIKEVAKIIVEKHGGRIEANKDWLAELPGVGPYVSSAVACIKGGERVAVVDANVGRVVGRIFGIDYKDAKRSKELWSKAEDIVPEGSSKEFNWALIDLGALVCAPRSPKCGECPLKRICVTAKSKS